MTDTLTMIIERLRSCGVNEPTDETRLCNVLTIGSVDDIYATPSHYEPLDVMNLIVWIEETFHFDVEIDDINVDNFSTPAVLALFIDKHKRG